MLSEQYFSLQIYNICRFNLKELNEMELIFKFFILLVLLVLANNNTVTHDNELFILKIVLI